MPKYTAAAQAPPSIAGIDSVRKRKSRLRSLPRPRSVAAHLSRENRYTLFDLGWLHILTRLNEVRVYLVLAAHADHYRGTCFPSEETIGREAGISDSRAVRRALQGLEEKGAIRRGFRKRGTTLYEVHPPRCIEAVRRVFPKAVRNYPRDPGRNYPPEATTLSDATNYS